MSKDSIIYRSPVDGPSDPREAKAEAEQALKDLVRILARDLARQHHADEQAALIS